MVQCTGKFNGLASHPGGSRNTSIQFMLQKPEISTSLMGYLVYMQNSPTLLYVHVCHLFSFFREVITMMLVALLSINLITAKRQKPTPTPTLQGQQQRHNMTNQILI